MIQSYPSYSIAIRTLGTAGEKFRKELESICAQSVQPERVIVYIAEGYDRPDYTVGREEYVWVQKGMVAQRVLNYDEISSECILMLDDDVCLTPNSAKRLLDALVNNNADCVGADVFINHKMPLKTKLYAFFTNLVAPHFNQKWAFIIHRNGSYSYIQHPRKAFYWSQKSDGPAAMWKKSAFLGLHLEEESWLDRMGFAYSDDLLESYKLFRNGGRLGILFNSGITHLDGQTASGLFRKSSEHLYIRTKASFMIWWRSCYKTGKDTLLSRFKSAFAFGFKVLWLFPIFCFASIIKLNGHYLLSYLSGLYDGWREVHSVEFQNLLPYVL